MIVFGIVLAALVGLFFGRVLFPALVAVASVLALPFMFLAGVVRSRSRRKP
jgi:hypothetical protein